MNEQKLYPMYCAWCGKVIGHTTVEGSHGICEECAEKLQRQAHEQDEIERMRRKWQR